MIEWLVALWKPFAIGLSGEAVWAISYLKGMPDIMGYIGALCWIFGWIIIANGADLLD